MPTLNWDKRNQAEKTLKEVPYKLLKLEDSFVSTAQHSTAQHSTAQHSTAQHTRIIY